MSRQPHTQVPNLIYDIVLWLVSEVERDCLLYIIRRTYGYHDGQGERKKRDIISLSQFEKGITTGEYLLDLGTNRSRNSLKSALTRLEERGLVNSRYACTHCLWEESPDTQPHSSNKCPRCNSSLTKSWALSQLTPNKILELLNSNERQRQLGRQFEWDSERRRFKVIDQGAIRDSEAEQASLESEYQQLRSELWYPELVDQAIELAGRKLKSGSVSKTRKVNGFFRPIVELQRDYPTPALVKYALEQTLAGPVFQDQGRDRNWFNYARRVAENGQSKFTAVASEPGRGRSAKEAELEVREMLREAARLNGLGQHDQARAKLTEIMAEVDAVVSLFDSRQQAEDQIKLAFKQGQSDFVGAKVDPFAPDYLN